MLGLIAAVFFLPRLVEFKAKDPKYKFQKASDKSNNHLALHQA
jgi:hypothetical protein